MSSKGYGSRRVCVSLCLSVKSHLTLEVSLHPESTVTYSAGDKGQKICETAPLPRLSAPSLGWPYIQSAIFPVYNTHVHCAYASSPGFAM